MPPMTLVSVILPVSKGGSRPTTNDEMGTFYCGCGDKIGVVVGRVIVVWCENAGTEGGLGAGGGSLSMQYAEGKAGSTLHWL
jgi:hypothetical protein